MEIMNLLCASFVQTVEYRDGGVIIQHCFTRNLKMGSSTFPAEEKTSLSTEPLPFVFVGDEAFALRPNFLKPFNQKL